MFPADDILLARGKYSTLSSERKAQLERVKGICATLVSASYAALRDCELRPPESQAPVDTIDTCIKNLKDARVRITALSEHMNELKPLAWPE